MRASALLAASLLLGSLAGCGWVVDDEGFIQDRSDDYREARNHAPPRIPGDLSADRISSTLVVPDVPMAGYDPDEDFRAPRPATLYARKDERSVRIQRLGEAAWIVAPDPPERIWPRVKQFLADNGVEVAAERPGTGEIETQWLQLADRGYRDVIRTVIAEAPGSTVGERPYHRLRLRVEQAVRRGATEIHVTHRAAGRRTSDAEWERGSSNPEAADTLLTELATYLAADVGEGSVSYLAQTIAAEKKAEIVRDASGYPVLRLRLGFERAWATIGTALDNASVPVSGAERDSGEYRIRFDPRRFESEEPGFWSRLFGGGGDGQPLTLRVREAGDAYEVAVYRGVDAGQRADRELGEQVLSVIREFAS